MHPLTAGLSWIGARAGWSLAVGMVLALAMPPLSDAFLRTVLPITSAFVLAVAFARLDTRAVVSQWREPAMRRLLLISLVALLPLGLFLTTLLARGLQLDPTLALCLALFAAAPPIASGAAICFMLGFDAVLALQLTVTITLLTPIIGPLCLIWIAGVDLPVTATALFSSLVGIIGGGLLIGRVFRRGVGAAWIDTHPRALDGLAAIAMISFVVPMFADVTDILFSNWPLTLSLLAGVCALNLGVNLAVRRLTARHLGDARAGAFGLISGNRNIALYYASLPPDPLVGLFVALYQVPMFLTPLLLKRAQPNVASD